MPGESIITIPADLIVLVRSGAYGDLHASLGELRGVIEACRNVGTVGQRYTLIEGCFARVDATRALLNLVGWTHFPVKGEVEVDLAQHRQALRGALSARRLICPRFGGVAFLESCGVDESRRAVGFCWAFWPKVQLAD
jgi:hypothetical protein